MTNRVTVKELEDEFAENGLYELAEYVGVFGIKSTLAWLDNRIVEVARGEDPWDPEGSQLGNLEVARDHLAWALKQNASVTTWRREDN